MSEFGRFFLPGPTEVRPRILRAMARPMLGHRGPEMSALMSRLQPGLRALFRTERPVHVATSSATGLMEAALRNGARHRVLSLVNGAFSSRFAEIARAIGLAVDELARPWGAAHDPAEVAAALGSGAYDAVTVVHSETSTGVLNPIREITAAAHDGDALALVDAVSSVGGAPVETDAWKLDYVLTGSQKALALPPGLALGVASPRLLERARESDRRGVYFDLLHFESRLERGQTPATPALPQLFALEAQLRDIMAETVERRWLRHSRMAEATWAWVDALRADGLDAEVLAPEPFRSPTVSCIRMPGSSGATRLVAGLAERGFVIAPGYGAERDRMIRIGHMGDHTLEELEDLLDAAGSLLRSSVVA